MPPIGASKHKKGNISQVTLFENYNESLVKITVALNEIWDRIGFNDETKYDRLRKFFESVEEESQNLLESEDDLEQKIRDSINDNRLNIRTLCNELSIKNDDKLGTELSMLDEEKLLRDKFKQLQLEKNTRLDEYEKFSELESALCDKLKQKKTTINRSVPTEAEIECLKSSVKDLEKLKIERVGKMAKYKEEITNLLYDLNSSDSFAETMVYESIENMQLSEEDLERAKDLRDQLKLKDEKLNDQIKSLKYKIKQLWTKLCFNNPELVDIVDSEDTCLKNSEDVNKSELLKMLNEEYDRCVKTKMDNLENYIEQIRIEISVYYEKLYFSDSEMKKFDSNFTSKDFTEDLLKQHEQKLEELKFDYDESQSLYEKTAKWLEFWEKFVTFEEQTKDPNRFKVRGYNSLEEEKARKQFSKEFPKLEDELRTYADEYKETNGGKIYTIYGNEWNVYLDLLRKDYEKHKLEQKNEKKQQTTVASKNKDNFLYSKHASKLSTPSTTFAKPSIKRKKNDETPRQTKLQKTDIPESTILKANTPKVVNNKLLTKGKAATRKSRTPIKTRLRQKVAVAAASNVTKVASNNTTTKSTTSKKGENVSPKKSKYKVPSKFLQQLDEDEDDSCETTLTATMSSKASSTTSSTVNASTYRTGGYPFKQIEINYQEFSRDLQKQPFKFKGNNNGAASNHQVDKDKLTSTFIS